MVDPIDSTADRSPVGKLGLNPVLHHQWPNAKVISPGIVAESTQSPAPPQDLFFLVEKCAGSIGDRRPLRAEGIMQDRLTAVCDGKSVKKRESIMDRVAHNQMRRGSLFD